MTATEPAPMNFYTRRRLMFFLVTLALIMLYTFHEPYPMDDAYISFRYAQNLVEGHGLVWNIGERVEGYSNFLWTLLIALGLKLGVHPEHWSTALGVPIQLANLLLTYRLGLLLLGSSGWALLLMALTGFNHSVAGFAASGLETSLQLLEFLLVGLTFIRAVQTGWTPKRTLALGLLLNLALLTRPDGIVLTVAALAGWAVTVYSSRKRQLEPSQSRSFFILYPSSFILSLILPFLLIAVPYAAWKFSYYGSLLPNSFNVKVRGMSGVLWGAYYVYLFLIYYMLPPYLAIVLWRAKRLWTDSPPLAWLGMFCAVWFGYVIFVGGDFMEFRFLVAITPFLMAVMLFSIKEFIPDRRVAAALVVGLLLANFNNMFAFGRMFYSYGVERTNSLKAHLYGEGEDWVAIGKRLHRMFGGTDVVICTGASGAIPYYARLRTVDFMGLTDANIPKMGERFSIMAGHRIIAPLDYIHSRGVNLIVEPINFMMDDRTYYKWLRMADWSAVYGYFMDIEKPVGGRIIDEVTLLAIPIEQGYTLLAWYLTPSPEVDRVIEEYNLRKIKLVRPR